MLSEHVQEKAKNSGSYISQNAINKVFLLDPPYLVFARVFQTADLYIVISLQFQDEIRQTNYIYIHR